MVGMGSYCAVSVWRSPRSHKGTLWDPRPSSARERRCLGLADPDPGGRVHRGDGGAAASALWALAGHP